MEIPDDLNPSRPGKTNKGPVLERVRRWYRALPDKKRYLEFVTAFLTIPVLLTVLLSNVSNLNRQKEPAATGTPSPAQVITVTIPPTDNPPFSASPTGASSPTATPQLQCTPGIGPISIVFPKEGSTVNQDPVCLDISRQDSNYCAVVWSWRINGGTWSDYTDRSVCVYGLSPGKKELELRVKSIANGSEAILERTFTVAGNTPTPTPATQSAVMNSL